MRTTHDPHYIEFIARLRTARKARGYTQAQLAKLLMKPQSFVSKIETCERRIDLIEAAQWCLALGATLDDMLPPSFKTVLPPHPAAKSPKSRRTH